MWLYEIIVNFKRLQNILTNDYEMCLHHNNSTMHFITSDNPVIKLQDEHIAKTPFCNFLSGGCSCRDIMLLFPLTPDNLLVLEHKKNVGRLTLFNKTDEQFVQAVNNYVVKNSINFLFSNVIFKNNIRTDEGGV